MLAGGVCVALYTPRGASLLHAFGCSSQIPSDGLSLTLAAHVCAILQGMTTCVILARFGVFYVRDTSEESLSHFWIGALSSMLHFVTVENLHIWAISFSWLSILDKVFVSLFSRLTEARSLNGCMARFAHHLQNPWLGPVNCSFDLSAFQYGINASFQNASFPNNSLLTSMTGNIWTNWTGVEPLQNVLFCVRFSVPLLCVVLYLHSLTLFISGGAASYRSGYYIKFTNALAVNSTRRCLGWLIKITIYIGMVSLILVGFIWAVLVELEPDNPDLVSDPDDPGWCYGYRCDWLIKPIGSRFYKDTWSLLGEIVYPLLLLTLSTYSLRSRAHYGFPDDVLDDVMMKPRRGAWKLQDNNHVMKHLVESIWQAQRNDFRKLQTMIEYPEPKAFLQLILDAQDREALLIATLDVQGP